MATLQVNAAFKRQVNFRVPPELKERLEKYEDLARQSKADIAVQKSTRLLQTNPLKGGGEEWSLKVFANWSFTPTPSSLLPGEYRYGSNFAGLAVQVCTA